MGNSISLKAASCFFIMFFVMVGVSGAESQVATGPQQSRDIDAVVQRRLNRITNEQRMTAAANARAARIAENPELAVRMAEARDAQDRAAKARIEAIRNGNGNSATLLRNTAERESTRAAKARINAANTAKGQGGANE